MHKWAKEQGVKLLTTNEQHEATLIIVARLLLTFRDEKALDFHLMCVLAHLSNNYHYQHIQFGRTTQRSYLIAEPAATGSPVIDVGPHQIASFSAFERSR
jgi:hypothetical protein